jgi:hypothetical protein
MCLKAGLSTIYDTTHCIRETCITCLEERYIEARHTMFISGYRFESSLKSYSQCVSETNKQEMFNAVSSTSKAIMLKI